MAHVVQDVARIDHFLNYSAREWEAVPSYVEEFATWDDVEQLTFIHEWAIRESALTALADYACHNMLTSAQSKRYRHVLALVAQHRPAIDRLLKG